MSALSTAHNLVRLVALLCLLMWIPGTAGATDLKVRLAGTQPITQRVISYECDASGAKIGVPSGRFDVEYVTGAGNSLVVVPVKGKSLIFVSVSSGSGVRYVAQEFTWWEAGGKVTLSVDSGNGLRSDCRKAQ